MFFNVFMFQKHEYDIKDAKLGGKRLDSYVPFARNKPKDNQHTNNNESKISKTRKYVNYAKLLLNFYNYAACNNQFVQLILSSVW